MKTIARRTVKAVCIDREYCERDYGMTGESMIIDHPTHGRLLISDGFGGMDSHYGGGVRWRHGMVVQLKPTDTFAGLRQEIEDTFDYPCYAVHLTAIREVMPWSGFAIDNLANSI